MIHLYHMDQQTGFPYQFKLVKALRPLDRKAGSLTQLIPEQGTGQSEDNQQLVRNGSTVVASLTVRVEGEKLFSIRSRQRDSEAAEIISGTCLSGPRDG